MSQHFKLSDKNSHHLITHPNKLAILIAVFIVIIICVLILIQIDAKNNLGWFKTKPIKNTEKLQNYPTEAKTILNDYLLRRANDDFKETEVCQGAVSETLNKFLALTLPAMYKEFHLAVVVILDKESQKCENYLPAKNELDQAWQKLLTSYAWLKN